MAGERIQIEDLPPTITQSRTDRIPTQKQGGGTVFLTIAQLLGLLNSSDVATAAGNATSDDSFDDTDEVVYRTGSSLKRGAISGLISSIFKTARTISNARFDGSSFGLILSTFRLAFAGTLTAARTVTFQDRDITVGMVLVSSGAIPFNAAVDFALPSGIRRASLVLNGYSTNGSSVPMVQLKSGGAAEATGYSGAASNSAATGGLANTSGINFNTGSSATLAYDVKVEVIWQSGTSWSVIVTGANSNPATIAGAGSKTLSAVLDGIRLRSANGTDVPDAGTYALFVEY